MIQKLTKVDYLGSSDRKNNVFLKAEINSTKKHCNTGAKSRCHFYILLSKFWASDPMKCNTHSWVPLCYALWSLHPIEPFNLTLKSHLAQSACQSSIENHRPQKEIISLSSSIN